MGVRNSQNWAIHNIQQAVRNAIVNVHGKYIFCCDRVWKEKKNMTRKTIHCNTFYVFLFMMCSRSSLKTSSTDLSKVVKCLLESGQTPGPSDVLLKQHLHYFVQGTLIHMVMLWYDAGHKIGNRYDGALNICDLTNIFMTSSEDNNTGKIDNR